MEGFPFHPWPQDHCPVGALLGWAAGAQPGCWGLPQAGLWPVLVLETGDASSSVIVVVLWESCSSHLLVVNWDFSVAVVNRTGEEHLKEASFHWRWIWFVQTHIQLLLGQEMPSWQPGCCGSCVWLSQVMAHFHCHPVQGVCMDRGSGMGVSSGTTATALSFSAKETVSWEPQCCHFPAGILRDQEDTFKVVISAALSSFHKVRAVCRLTASVLYQLPKTNLWKANPQKRSQWVMLKQHLQSQK